MLFFERNVEPEFQDDCAVLRQMFFMVSYRLVALLPQLIEINLIWQPLCVEEFRVDTNDQNFFIITSIENSDPASLRQAFCCAPQKIVIQLFLCWLLK